MSAMKSQPQKTPAASTVDSAVPHHSQARIFSRTERRELFGGPLPHPELLKQYEQTLPGIAERIVKMAEEEQANRLAIAKADSEQKAKLIEIADRECSAIVAATALGQKIGLCISVACIALAFASAYMGMDKLITMAFLAVPTASFISSFFPGKQNEHGH